MTRDYDGSGGTKGRCVGFLCGGEGGGETERTAQRSGYFRGGREVFLSLQ